MFSRFRRSGRSRPGCTASNSENLGAREPRSARHAAALALLAITASLLWGCATAHDQADTWEKHYIDPPKQKKIPASDTALRVCADPNNLPFSNSKGEGFENKIAALVASEMKRPVEYTWWAERRGFFRNTLKDGKCDVVMGVPASFELAATTKSYYRSTYVFVTRKDSKLDISSFDDPRLKTLKIGVQMVGDDGANTPPVHALNDRGIVNNLRGYTLYGDYAQRTPAAEILNGLVNKDIDVAVVWGPLAGYYAATSETPLEIRPVTPEIDLPYRPLVYDIAVGVRRGEDDLKNRIDAILARRHDDIDKILASYHMPRPASAAKEGV